MRKEALSVRSLSGKALSLLIALVMAFGLVASFSLSAVAEGDKAILAFTSDVHNDANNTTANRLRDWIADVQSQTGDFDAMGFCGDLGTASGNGATWFGYVQNVMDVVEKEYKIPAIYTTGNHEFMNGQYSSSSVANNATRNKYIVDQEGLVGDNYRIYALGTNNWDSYQDNYTTEQVNKLADYLDSVGNDKPIIIITHFPLHSDSGSSRQTTNADRIISVLNNAATTKGQTIVFLWGHNHTFGDSHYGYIYDPGATIQIDRAGTEKTIGFYYAGAGAMADQEYGQSAAVIGKGLVLLADNKDSDGDGYLDLDFTFYDINGVASAAANKGHVTGDGEPSVDPDEPTPGTSTKYVEIDPSDIEAGKDYVIGVTGSDGNLKAIKAGSGSSGYGSSSYVSSSSLAVSVDGDQYYVSVSDSNLVWRSAASTDSTTSEQGFSMKNGDNYLFPGSDGEVRYYTQERTLLISANGIISHISSNNTETAGQRFYMADGPSEGSNPFKVVSAESSATAFRFFEKTNEQGDDPDPVDPPTGNTVDITPSAENPEKSIKINVGDTLTINIKNSSNNSGYEYSATMDKSGIAEFQGGSSVNIDQGKTGQLTVKGLAEGTVDINISNNNTQYGTQYERTGVIHLTVGEGGTTPDDPQPGTGTDYQLVDVVKDGGEYLIVNKDSAGSAYALKNPGGTSDGADMGATSVTVSSDKIITTDATDVVWTVTYNGDGFNLTNGSDYLEGKSGNVSVFDSQQYPARYWTYTGNQLQHVGGRNTYTVYYSGGYTSTYNETSEKVYFYEKVGTTPQDPVAVESVTVSGPEELEVGETANLTVKVLPTNATNKGVTYSVSPEGVVSVDANGKVTALKEGEATITVTTDDGGKTATCTIKVVPAPEATKYELVDVVKDGGEYLIVNANEAGSAYALRNPGGTSNGETIANTANKTAVTIKSGEVAPYIEIADTDVVWTVTENGDGFNLTNGSDYLEGKSGNVSVFNSQQYPARYWTYSAENLLQHVGGQSTYTIRYSSSNNYFQGSTSNTGKVYFYEKVEGDTPGHEHTLEAVPAVEPTCTTGGNTAYWICTGCGKYFSDAEGKNEIAANSWAIEALGHKYEQTAVVWNDDHTSVEITYVCANDPQHIEKITSTDIATEEGEDGTTYTASFKDPDGKDQTVSEFVPSSTPEPAEKWKRLAGEGRLDTMQAIVQEGFTESDCAVLSTGWKFPDALVASAVAGQLGCPVILTDPATLSDQAAAELNRLGVKHVYIMGSNATVTDGVANQLFYQTGVTKVDRIEGIDRRDTSLQALKWLDGAEGGNAYDGTVVVTTGVVFADALAIGPWCYRDSVPILLTDASGGLSDGQWAALEGTGVSTKVKNVIVLGGTDRVSQATRDRLASIADEVTELGADSDSRYQTAAEIAAWEISEQGMGAAHLTVTKGSDFPDALAGAALCGKTESVMVLVNGTAPVDDPQNLFGFVIVAFESDEIETGYVLGDEKSVPKTIWDYLNELTGTAEA